MVNHGNAVNASKPHAIDRYFQTEGTNVIAVVAMGIQDFYKLASIRDADMVLLATSATTLANMGGLAVGTLRRVHEIENLSSMKFIPYLCNAAF